nr:hypothetical protein CFP56_16804 [Quercus suber]
MRADECERLRGQGLMLNTTGRVPSEGRGDDETPRGQRCEDRKEVRLAWRKDWGIGGVGASDDANPLKFRDPPRLVSEDKAM